MEQHHERRNGDEPTADAEHSGEESDTSSDSEGTEDPTTRAGRVRTVGGVLVSMRAPEAPPLGEAVRPHRR